MIGVFTLDIGKLMNDLKDERREETKVIEDINKKLREICSKPEFAVPNYDSRSGSINQG